MTQPPAAFDRVLVLRSGRWEPMTMEAFFSLPLSDRIRHVIERTVAFQLDGKDVDIKDALAAMRQARAKQSGGR